MNQATHLPMPNILYGTAWKAERTAELVEQALALGFRGIDTACQPKHYHEAGVGVGVAAALKRGLKRSDLYLQTKFTPLDGQDPLRVPYDINASLSEQVALSFQVSLLNLQTDYLDGLVLHSPLSDPQQLLIVWRAMEGLVKQGGVKRLGISNCYDVSQLRRLYEHAEINPSILQNRFYANTGYDQALRVFCQQQQLVYQSFWTLSANPHILSHPKLQTLAKQYLRSPAQIFFRYLSQQGIVPLTGTTSIQHMQESLAIGAFELSADECSAIASLLCKC